jgi:hypothetical protein
VVFRAIIVLSLSAAAGLGQVSVVALGAHSDGTNAAATTAAFRSAFATYSSSEIIVPPGTYLIDNSSGALLINNFSGQLEFEGSAQLVFTTNSMGGLFFESGTGARIDGLHATYSVAPTVRASPNEQIKFSDTTDTTLTNTIVQNSPAAGVLFYNSIRPKVVNLTVLNSLADGLHFANCQDPQVTNLTTVNTGDDALAFLNYAIYPNNSGGFAENIKITNSHSRGISILGQSNVTISNFQIQATSSSGVLVAQDTAYNTRVPAGVKVQNGSVTSAGTLAPLAGNQYGVEYNSQSDATFSNITITDSGSNGLSGVALAGSVIANGVKVVAPRSGVGFLFYQTASAQVQNSTSQNTPSDGFLFLQSPQVIAQGLTAINAAQTDTLRRAIWFEDGQSILATDLKIVSAAGGAYIVGAYQASGYANTGSIKGITASITGATLAIQNNSSKLTITP